jgi:hypothetical protein
MTRIAPTLFASENTLTCIQISKNTLSKFYDQFETSEIDLN